MAADLAELKARAERLRALHGDDMLVLPNVWDAASARTVAQAGFPVAATSSAAIAAMLGHPDGERAPWQEMFAAAGRVAKAVKIPMSVDAEAGYGMSPHELVDRLLEIGAAGCNVEDSDHRAGGLVDAGQQAEWLAEMRAMAAEAGVAIVINARTDVFLPSSGIAEPARVEEAVRRGRLYRDAGADCVYPVGVRHRRDIATLVTEIPGPLNGNTSEHVNLATLRELGVARVSFGPRFYRHALASLHESVHGLSAEALGLPTP